MSFVWEDKNYNVFSIQKLRTYSGKYSRVDKQIQHGWQSTKHQTDKKTTLRKQWDVVLNVSQSLKKPVDSIKCHTF